MTTKQAPPPSWPGTEPEWTLFNVLQSMGYAPGRDFRYSPSDDEPAFRFLRPPDLGISVIGLMQNYAKGIDGLSRDVMTRQKMLSLGVHLIFLEDVDLQQDPEYYVEEALRYRDHSHMGS